MNLVEDYIKLWWKLVEKKNEKYPYSNYDCTFFGKNFSLVCLRDWVIFRFKNQPISYEGFGSGKKNLASNASLIPGASNRSLQGTVLGLVPRRFRLQLQEKQTTDRSSE